MTEIDYSRYKVTHARLMELLRHYSPRGWAELMVEEYFQKQGKPFDEQAVADASMIQFTEQLVTNVIGRDAARSVLKAFLEKGYMHISDVMSIIDGGRYFFHFSQELLRASIENLEQGISVVDKDLRLIVWNSRYVALFDYPPGLVVEGRPVDELIRFNAQLGECGPGDIETLVERRIKHLKNRHPHFFERHRKDGKVIAMHGNPIPGGGYVTSFSDITAHKQLVYQLKENKRNLEQRVSERTKELTELNHALQNEIITRGKVEEDLRHAKAAADKANLSKTKFLAAASHDLMQPLNAAGLFCSALAQRLSAHEDLELIHHIESSISAAEVQLDSLMEASKLDAGVVKPKLMKFPLSPLLETLAAEFTVLAEEKGLGFRKVPSSYCVLSNPQLLRRILQNFLSNAIRYTQQGRLLLGCRRKGALCQIEVWDTGRGIPQDKLQEIFREFHRLDQSDEILSSERGTGLGLAISDRIAKLLGHNIVVHSRPGLGSMFALQVPIEGVDSRSAESHDSTWKPLGGLEGCKVLCIDNDEAVLEGMQALLSAWGCHVICAVDEAEVLRAVQQHGAPDIALVDYQLDSATGIEVMDAIQAKHGLEVPRVVITANKTREVHDRVKRHGCELLIKPIKPAALRAVMSSLLD